MNHEIYWVYQCNSFFVGDRLGSTKSWGNNAGGSVVPCRPPMFISTNRPPTFRQCKGTAGLPSGLLSTWAVEDSICCSENGCLLQPSMISTVKIECRKSGQDHCKRVEWGAYTPTQTYTNQFLRAKTFAPLGHCHKIGPKQSIHNKCGSKNVIISLYVCMHACMHGCMYVCMYFIQ